MKVTPEIIKKNNDNPFIIRRAIEEKLLSEDHIKKSLVYSLKEEIKFWRNLNLFLKSPKKFDAQLQETQENLSFLQREGIREYVNYLSTQN